MKEFTVCRKGYDPAEVDAYIAELEGKLAATANELNALRGKEAAINRSLIDAQVCAEGIKAKAAEAAAQMRGEALNEMNDIRGQVEALHTKLNAFQNEYSEILQRYLVSLRSNDLVSLFANLESFMKRLDLPVAPEQEAPVELTDLGMEAQ